MSFKATSWAWKLEIRTASAKLVLLCLADCYNDDTGRCNPSIPFIAKATGLDPKTVRKALRQLIDEGAIAEAICVSGKSAHYALDFSLTPTNIGTPTKNGTPTKIGTTTPTKSGRAPLPKLVPEPIKNLEVNLSRELNVSFDTFWSVYPRKAGKTPAAKKWPKLNNTDRDSVMAFLAKNPYRGRDPQYIPHATTFLNQRRWEDEIDAPTKNNDHEELYL